MISIKKTYTILFFIGLFFFPFNSFEGLKFLGEYKNESAAYLFFAGFFFLGIDLMNKKKITIPFKSIIFKTLIFFICWCIVSTLINYFSVSENYFKHTTGFVRFIRQFISLIISACIFPFLYWNVIIKMTLKDILNKIRKTFLLSLIIATVYGFLELGIYKFNYVFLKPILKLFNYFPFLEEKIIISDRISSISFEPPFFAVYLISISGWMFSYILTETKKIKYLPAITIIVLTYYSGSRTGLIVVFIQLLVFLSITMSRKQKIIAFINTFISIIILSLFVLIFNQNSIFKDISKKIESLDFNGNMKKNISNQSRFGIQYASLMVFSDHPITGVGLGQQAYHAKKYYPGWAKKDNWEFKYIYLNSNEPSFPPGYNLFTRLLAETGIIGTLTFLLLIYFSIKQTLSIIRSKKNEVRVLGIALLVTFVGLYINWLQIDTFRVYILWLSLCILIKIQYDKRQQLITNNQTDVIN